MLKVAPSSPGFTVNRNMAAQTFDDAMGYRKTQPGALAYGFGGEIRIKYFFLNYTIHARSGIADFKPGISSGRQSQVIDLAAIFADFDP